MDEPQTPEAIDTGETPGGEPVFTLDTETNRVTLAWPFGKPEAVFMTPDVLEEWVRDRNQLLDRVRTLEEVLATIRLGRRPSAEVWRGLSLPPIPREDRIDLMRRSSIPRQGGSPE